MKAADFNYVRPNTLEEALSLVSKADDDIVVMSGGQSLIPMMNFRLVEPSSLIDISKLSELQKIEEQGNTLEIGAGVTYTEIEKSDIINSKIPLLSHVIEFIAHSAIRNRGTIGGSVALADPAAEMPALLIALNATVVLRSQTEDRFIKADEFFIGTYETALKPNEIVVKISLPITEVNYGFYEVTRRHGDYASAGAIITVHKQNNSNTQNSRVVLFASTNKPERIIGLEDILNQIEPGTTPIINKETITDALMNTKLEKDLHNSERTKFIHSVTALKRALEMIK